MITLRDIATAASTRFEVWFNEEFNKGVEAVEAQVGGLLATIDMGDGEGDRVRIDWLGGIPPLRQWIDEKRAKELFTHNWTVAIKDWESTVRFKLNTLRDSRGNMYEPRIRAMAMHAARHPFQAISDLVRLGKTTVGYDGQYYFDTDHSEGNSGSQTNKLTGSGTTLAQVVVDFYAAKAKLMNLKDDQGEPFWPGMDFRPLIWAPSTGPLMQAFQQLQNESQLVFVTGSQSNNAIKGTFDVVYDPKQTDLTDWTMFNPESHLKPLVRINREPIHYVDNFSSGDLENPSVWAARIAEAGVEGRDAYDYAMWQSAVLVENA